VRGVLGSIHSDVVAGVALEPLHYVGFELALDPRAQVQQIVEIRFWTSDSVRRPNSGQQ
jgi:hypothetical protein